MFLGFFISLCTSLFLCVLSSCFCTLLVCISFWLCLSLSISLFLYVPLSFFLAFCLTLYVPVAFPVCRTFSRHRAVPEVGGAEGLSFAGI